MKSKLIAIAALGKKRQIGLNNALPWKMPDEYQHFLRAIEGKYVLTGRKNFELHKGKLPAKGVFVLTHQQGFSAPHAIVVKSFEEFEQKLEQLQIAEVFVMGGAEVYKLTLPLISEFYYSEIDYDGPADTFFPEFEQYSWRTLKEEQHAGWKFKLLAKSINR